MSSVTKTIFGTDQTNMPFLCSFSGKEFAQMTGSATLQGPLSLAFTIVYSQISVGVYIGIQIETMEGRIYVADRTQIAYLPQLQPGTTQGNVTISSASIPTLARIEGTIKKITLLFTALSDMTSTSFAVTLSVNAPTILSAPVPYIGKDTSVFNPGVIVLANAVPTIANGASFATVTSILVPVYCRLRVHSFELWSVQTAAIGNFVVYLRLTDPNLVITTIARLDNETTRRAFLFGTFNELILPANWQIGIYASNTSGSSQGTEGSIVGEYIL